MISLRTSEEMEVNNNSNMKIDEILNKTFIESLLSVYRRVGIISPKSYIYVKIEDIMDLELDFLGINNIVAKYGEENLFRSSLKGNIELFSTITGEFDFLSGVVEMLIYELACFTKFFFNPTMESLQVTRFDEGGIQISFEQDGIQFNSEKNENESAIELIVKMANEAIKNRNLHNPLLYTIPLGDETGVISLTQENYQLLCDNRLMIFDSFEYPEIEEWRNNISPDSLPF